MDKMDTEVLLTHASFQIKNLSYEVHKMLRSADKGDGMDADDDDEFHQQLTTKGNTGRIEGDNLVDMFQPKLFFRLKVSLLGRELPIKLTINTKMSRNQENFDTVLPEDLQLYLSMNNKEPTEDDHD